MAPVLRRLAAIPSRLAASRGRPGAIPMLLACGAALAACGGHGSPNASSSARPAPSTKTAHTASPPSTQRPAHTSAAVAQAQAFAHAVNFQASDLPGFAVSSEHKHHHEGAAEKRLEQELHACAGGAGVTGTKEHSALAEASSGTFERKGGIASQSVSSTVTVEPSAAAATKLLGALHSTALRSCLSHAFSGLLRAQHIPGASVGAVSVKYGSPPAPGTSGGYALRVRTTIVVHQIPIPFYLDILGFVDGQAEVSMLAITIPQPLTATLEEHLYNLLLERARTHTV
ncbi:MAG TPA: hypothetical protein VK765_00940 [Solirubrobacteraceae bacterium]|jgi:hypothetical protein|nr:hypothetical protein [Solirubrobacteraceae bacterium]